MTVTREIFKEGEIPLALCISHCKDLSGLNGEWTLVGDHRSDGMKEITEFFGLDPRDRTAWEFSQHLNAPRIRLDLSDPTDKHAPASGPDSNPNDPRAGDHPLQLTVTCHGAILADCPRAIIFDGIEKKGIPISKVVPHAPLRHMGSGFDEGTFVAAEIDGILFVKYQMRKGTFYMTRILLDHDPEGREPGPITLAQYCVITNDGEKHVALRYHKRL